MFAYRHIDKLVIVLVLLALLALGAFAALAAEQKIGVTMAYEDALFDETQFLYIDITIDESDWQELLDDALSESYYRCDVAINGVTCANVGIRVKGNTSLSMVAASNSDRYSFKLQFDEYVSGQSFLGLDKLVLNNNYADATMLREAIVYDMFNYLDADASLWNYASVSVNGEPIGVYLALEAVEESFALRSYGVDYGECYKPDDMEMGGAGRMNQVDPDGLEEMFRQGSPTEDSSDTAPSFDISVSPGQSGSAAGLDYLGDDPDSYSTIWASSVFDSTDADHQRVITALKNIDAGTDLERYLDVDNMLRFLAVHSFVVNLDSLSGSMAHNYYLYEENGTLNMIPWDYNLAFGGFRGGDASDIINFPIDTPFSGEERQFFMVLLNNTEYLTRYHDYLHQLVDEYVGSGRLDALYTSLRTRLDPLVDADPTAFYSYEEYDAAAEMLLQTIRLRAESVSGQLDGSIPSTTDGQNADSSALIDASSIQLSVMGTMGGDEGKKEMDENNEMPSSSTPPAGFAPDGQGTPPDSTEQTRRGPGAGMESAAPAAGSTSEQTAVLYGVSLVLLLAALLWIVKFKRR